MQIPPACGNRPDRVHKLLVSGVLQDVSGRSRPERLTQIRTVVRHRQHEHVQVGPVLLDPSCGLDTPDALHHQVHQHDAGLAVGGSIEQFVEDPDPLLAR
jgi:hypothetical protein